MKSSDIICKLKGYPSDSISEKAYQVLRQEVNSFIEALVKLGYPKNEIRINCDDKARVVNFGYTPIELDALLDWVYPLSDSPLQRFTYQPFETGEGWCGYKYRLYYKDDQKTCIKKIDTLCREYDSLAETYPSEFSHFNFPDLQQDGFHRDKKTKQGLKVIFDQKQTQALFITEIHHHQYPKQFIAKNMAFFKAELGIQTIFFEFLVNDREQHLLDQYFESPTNDLPFELAAYLRYNDQASGNKIGGYTEIVKAAKSAGIRIVALDSYESILTCKELNKQCEKNARLKTFNLQAYKIIKKECKGSNFLCFTGLDHAYAKRHSNYPNIKSLAQFWPEACVVFLSDDAVNLSKKNLFNPSYPHLEPNGDDIFQTKNNQFGAHVVSVRNCV